MNLLSELEGLSGENLTTAVLRLLLLRSQEIREEFMKVLSAHSRLGRPLTVDSHFGCVLERYTKEKDSTRWGRLDLLLETSDAVIGLENKLFAGFQEGQPHKYLDSVQKHAAQLSDVRQTPLLYLVAVLAPSSRSREVEQHIGDNRNLLHVSWEEVREALKPIADTVDRDTALILRSLESFLQDHLAFLPGFSEWVPHLQGRFDPGGSPLQKQVVSKLWQFFPYPGPRLSSGKTWLGYYFAVGFKFIRGWFGFVAGDEIQGSHRHGAELVVATAFEMNLPHPPFRPIKLKSGAAFLGLKREDEIFTWALDYEKTWVTPEAWSDALTPIREHIEKLVKDASASSEAG